MTKAYFVARLLRQMMCIGTFVSLATAFHPALAQSDSTSLQPGRSRIDKIEITKRVSPAFAGKSFGSIGQYELLIGRAHGLADPKSLRNAGIVDLDHAPVNAEGLVDYSFDIMLLKPIDLTKTNGTLVFEVSNRGRPLLHTSLLNGDGDFTKASGAGSTFVLQQGYILAWTGWQADIGGSEGGDLAADYPVATNNGQPITGWVRDELAIDGSSGAQVATIPANATSFDAPLYYPLAKPDQPLKLSIRERGDDIPQPISPDQVTITGPKSLQIKLMEGFDRGALYSVEYEARDPKVMGLAFASMRDFVSLLRYGNADGRGAANPLANAGRSTVARTIAIGLSQSGRYQRDFLYQDFNVDEAGRRVFDGMIPQGGGAKRGFFNARFAEPGRSPDLQHEMRGYPGASFPFTYGEQIDLVTRRADGILSRCERSASCPKVMQLDSDWEQWQQAGSLVVTDQLGRPIQLPDNVRAYMVAGAPHATLPPNAGIATPPQDLPRRICEQRMNPLTWAPVLRALVFDMNAWIADGTAPPASHYPASADEGRVGIDTLRNLYPAIPDAPFSPAIGKLQLTDYSVNPPRPISTFAPYAVGVMAVDHDGNAEHGVILPEIAAPIATYSGRNTRAKGYAQGELCGTLGSSIPFARTTAERRANGDPRLSIEERYKDESDYRNKLTEAARKLVAERLMLQEDADAYASYSLPK